MRWWEELFRDEMAEYLKVRSRGPQPMGTRPALLVVDVTRAFTGPPGTPPADAVKEFPTACGPAAWEAISHIAVLLDVFRTARLPVVYTTAMPGGAVRFGGTVKGELDGMDTPMDWPGAQEIPAEIAPRPGELVLQKSKASAFFATPLLAHLHRQRADSLVVTGGVTSGCVRATVVDGFSWGYPTFVVEEAVFDRARLSHGVSLFEMNVKYADVVGVEDIRRLVKR